MKQEESRAQVSLRHKKEWQDFKQRFLVTAMQDNDAESAKLAKALADLLKVYQEGERKAWDFVEDNSAKDNVLEIKWSE